MNGLASVFIISLRWDLVDFPTTQWRGKAGDGHRIPGRRVLGTGSGTPPLGPIIDMIGLLTLRSLVEGPIHLATIVLGDHRLIMIMLSSI